jgi:hypothetical protein
VLWSLRASEFQSFGALEALESSELQSFGTLELWNFRVSVVVDFVGVVWLIVA